jgi:5-methylcytosine-specific restriction endonuclease McrA
VEKAGNLNSAMLQLKLSEIFLKSRIFMTEIYEGLQPCNPKARKFPISWKEAYFRLNFNSELEGYVCPICQRLFRGSKGFKELRADHIHPFSKGGLTTWDNLQLLCISCNSKKSNKLN